MKSIGCSVLVLLSLICLLGLPRQAEAAIITAASCNNTAGSLHVQAAVDSAVDGDTVLIPAGTCTWTTQLTIPSAAFPTPKYFTLRGQNDCTLGTVQGKTNIPTACPTMIVDNVTKTGSFPHLISWTVKPGGLSRLAHISLDGGTVADASNHGMSLFDGDSSQWRIDHTRQFAMTSTAFFMDNLTGVMDHNYIAGNNAVRFYITHNTWHGVGLRGDNSWTSACDFGGSDMMFVEDNVFEFVWVSGQAYRFAHDGWHGGRIVYRYNRYENTLWANHGLESGRDRSQRCTESYNNTFNINYRNLGAAIPMGPRGGEQRFYDNTVTSTLGTPTTIATFNYYRPGGSPSFNLYQAIEPWGFAGSRSISTITHSGSTATAFVPSSHGYASCTFGCRIRISGANQAEYNGTFNITPRLGVVNITSSSVANPTVITTSTPHNFITGEKVVISSTHINDVPNLGVTPSDGTTANGNPVAHTITVTGASTFTINVNVTNGGTGGTATPRSFFTYTMTCVPADCSGVPSPATGTILQTSPYDENADSTGYRAMDQTGVGAGDLISGDTPAIPVGGLHQAVAPAYCWGNTLNGSLSNCTSTVPTFVVIGRDVLNSATKPAALSSYTPYQYPHPLQGADTLAPAAPTGITVQ